MPKPTLPAKALPAWINRGAPYWPIDIAAVERRRDATYMGDFCLRSRFGGWTEFPCAVFWQEEPPDPGYSHYFGLHVQQREVFIVGAGSAAQGHWDGLVADSGEVVYSRFRHDYRRSGDGTVTVDGGRDYFNARGGAANPQVRIALVRDRLVVNGTLLLPYAPPGAGPRGSRGPRASRRALAHAGSPKREGSRKPLRPRNSPCGFAGFGEFAAGGRDFAGSAGPARPGPKGIEPP